MIMNKHKPTYFDVQFFVEQEITVDGEEFYFEGTAHLTGCHNGEWTLDSLDGRIVADGDYIPLVGRPELERAFINWLKKDKKFQSRADYETANQD
jgi:hypothetical protein